MATIFLSMPSARRATRQRLHQSDGLSISIRALREEGDMVLTHNCRVNILFLSTPSVRRATASPSPGTVRTVISIHALREEGDPT